MSFVIDSFVPGSSNSRHLPLLCPLVVFLHVLERPPAVPELVGVDIPDAGVLSMSCSVRLHDRRLDPVHELIEPFGRDHALEDLDRGGDRVVVRLGRDRVDLHVNVLVVFVVGDHLDLNRNAHFTSLLGAASACTPCWWLRRPCVGRRVARPASAWFGPCRWPCWGSLR